VGIRNTQVPAGFSEKSDSCSVIREIRVSDNVTTGFKIKYKIPWIFNQKINKFQQAGMTEHLIVETLNLMLNALFYVFHRERVA
jgi:hypothetical protein